MLAPWLDLKKLGLQKDQEKVFPYLLEFLAAKPGELTECLLGTRDTAQNCDAEMPKIVRGMMEEFPRESIDTALLILSRLVQKRNKVEKFKVALPAISVRVPRTINPYIQARWGGLAKMDCWQGIHIREITNNPTLERHELAYGRVLVSAILWGGLLSLRSISALFELLRELPAHADLAHGSLSITWMEGANYRRWFPDRLTSLLLLRLPETEAPVRSPARTTKQQRRKTRDAVTKAVLGYFCHSDETREQCPLTLHELLDAALLRLELRLPRALSEYAAGKKRSHSLRPKAWRRLMSQPPVEETSFQSDQRSSGAESSREIPFLNAGGSGNEETGSTETEDEAGDSYASEDPELGNHLDLDPDWLPVLRQLLRPASKKAEKVQALRDVRAYLKRPDVPPVCRILAGFARELLEQHAKSRKGNTLKTLRTQVVAVATRLPGLVNLANPDALNRDTLQAAYQQILEDAVSENQRQKLAGYLRAFHHYLKKTRFVEPIDESETFGSGNEDLTVDANLIVEDEYTKARVYLSEGHPRNRRVRPADALLREAAGLIMVLGFRCGLRRMEALKLQLNDLHEQNPAELLIRPWEQRRLKTPSATRKMPLYALLQEAELDRLHQWKMRREEEIKTERHPSPFLFAIPSMGYSFLPEGLVFPLIHDALRAVTSDPTVHFHHLRHAFGSWMTYALMQPSGMPLPQWMGAWPETARWLLRSKELHGTLYGNNFQTRRHLLAGSSLLGHSGTEISVEHYNHIIDQLLARWIESQPPLFKAEVWIAASGFPASTVYRLLVTKTDGKRWRGSQRLVERRWRESFGREQAVAQRPPAPVRSETPLGHSPDARNNALVWLDHLWLLLYLRATEKSKTEDLARRFGFSEELVDELIVVAAEAQQLQAGKKTFVHPFETVDARRHEEMAKRIANPEDPLYKSRQPDAGERIGCPRKPREEQEVIARFAPRLFELLEKKQDLCISVLSHWLWSPRNERNGLEFRVSMRELAKDYRKFLRALGVRIEELVVLRFTAAEDLAAWELWQKALQLKENEAVEPAAPRAPEKAARNDIGIKVVFPSHPRGKTETKRASVGMRYLFLMAGIWVVARSRVAGKGDPGLSLPKGADDAE